MSTQISRCDVVAYLQACSAEELGALLQDSLPSKPVPLFKVGDEVEVCRHKRRQQPKYREARRRCGWYPAVVVAVDASTCVYRVKPHTFSGVRSVEEWRLRPGEVGQVRFVEPSAEQRAATDRMIAAEQEWDRHNAAWERQRHSNPGEVGQVRFVEPSAEQRAATDRMIAAEQEWERHNAAWERRRQQPRGL